MRKIGIPVILVLLFAGTWSCQKEEYTLPADLRLDMSIDSRPVMGGRVTIESVKIRLDAIDIEGYRQTGENVFLTRSYNKGKIFSIRGGAQSGAVDFDIPQGVYSRLSFSLIFRPDDEEEDILEDIEEWKRDVEKGKEKLKELEEDLGDIIEDYLDDIKPSMIIQGRYSVSGSSRELIILMNDPLTFRLMSKSASGGGEVIIDSQRENSGLLTFDPSYWFAAITPEILDGAFLGREDGVTYIFLSKHINSQIYQALFSRIEESTNIIINQ